jgi:hypothetical protein
MINLLAKFIGPPAPVLGRRSAFSSLLLIVHKSRFCALLLLCLALPNSTVRSLLRSMAQRWRVYLQKFCGDAILVSKTEAASALIYWDGKRYGWYQQAD